MYTRIRMWQFLLAHLKNWLYYNLGLPFTGRKNKELAELPGRKKSRKKVLMQILSQDKKKKWKMSRSRLQSVEGKTTQPPCLFVAKKYATRFFVGFNSTTKGEFRPAPPQKTPTKPTSDQRLQLAAATATVAIPLGMFFFLNANRGKGHVG